jgi:hypothetical protein
MQIDLSPEEVALLREILRSSYDDLREEIYKTEDTDFKRDLKSREQALEALLAKLGPG